MLLIVAGVSSACGPGLPAAAPQPGGTGASGGNGGDGSGGALSLPPPVTSLPAEQPCTTGSAGPRLMRRLTADQFAATVADLFGDATVPTPTIFNDSPVLGFTVDSGSLVVQGLAGQQLMDSAETVAHWAVTHHLAQLAPCSSTDPTCPRTFIQSFGRRAFRAPLSETRIQDYAQLFAGEASFADGVEAVVGAMLQSPYFLYRRELGAPAATAATPGSELALLPQEIASELSYLVLGSMPDDTLLAAAESGELSTPQGIDRQFDRLLADPRSADSIMRFARGWLELDRLNTTVKDDTVFMLTDSLRQSMANETRGLFLDVFNSGGGLAELVTADHSYLDASLAQFYGLPTAALGNLAARVDYPALPSLPALPGARDRGFLAHASLLVGHAKGSESSPTQRGRMVRERLLCLPVPPMPTNLDTALKPPTGAQTTRQHYEAHSTSEPCRGCHVLMDPIGFGFEHYDSFGRYREQDNNVPVDATGTLNGVKEGAVAFDGIGGLAAYLAGSDAARTCVARYWAYVAYGAPTWEQDACTYAAIRSEAATQNQSFASVLAAIVHAPHFTRRAATP
jgi:Protein of unknown function (DUF1592)/Protein of unknown function (DUF1588)/Protein of unknown function (DUF1595)/Protein of unknown function (DUF1587)/Protein of unknown function (DUF1585)